MTPHYFFTTLLFFPLVLHISSQLWFLAVYILHSLNAFFFKASLFPVPYSNAPLQTGNTVYADISTFTDVNNF